MPNADLLTRPVALLHIDYVVRSARERTVSWWSDLHEDAEKRMSVTRGVVIGMLRAGQTVVAYRQSTGLLPACQELEAEGLATSNPVEADDPNQAVTFHATRRLLDKRVLIDQG